MHTSPHQSSMMRYLNGGIPVSEVNDEYIRDDFKERMSVRIIKKDNEYYEFQR